MDVIEGVKEIPVWGARYSPPERNDGGPEAAVFVRAGQVCSWAEGHAVGCQEQVEAFDVAPSFLMVSSECFWSSFNLEMV